MKSIFVLLLLCMLNRSVQADAIADEMKKRGFVEKPVPTTSDDKIKANRDSKSFRVSLDPKLTIEQIENGRARGPIIVDAGTVKYIGVNNGEFGGGLYLNEISGNQAPFFGGNIQALIPLNDDLYILSGLSHMTSSHGEIHVIRNYKSPTPPVRVTLLPDAPAAALVIEDRQGRKSIVFVGSSSLMEFTPDSRLELIAFDAFWFSLYPTSVVKQSDSYFIGLRSGVAVVTPNLRMSGVRYFVPES